MSSDDENTNFRNKSRNNTSKAPKSSLNWRNEMSDKWGGTSRNQTQSPENSGTPERHRPQQSRSRTSSDEYGPLLRRQESYPLNYNHLEYTTDSEPIFETRDSTTKRRRKDYYRRTVRQNNQHPQNDYNSNNWHEWNQNSNDRG